MKLLKNAIYNMIYQIFGIIIPIVTVPYVSRVLGSEGIGEYSYTNSYVQYFVILGMIGISLYGNRQIAYHKKNKEKVSIEFWSIYLLQFICTLISFIIYIVIFVIINKNNRILYLAQSINLIATMFDISWLFIGFEDMKSVVVKNFVIKIIGVILIFIFIKDINDLTKYIIILALSTLIGQLVMWINLKEKIKVFMPSLKEIKKHFLPASKLFISQLAVQIYVLLDKTMLGIMTTDSQVGYYENSQKTIKLALTLATSIGAVMLPRMASLYSDGKNKEFKQLVYKSFSFISFLAFPTLFGIIAIADRFAPWFYGSSFDGIQNLIKVGAAIIIAISWSNVLGMQIMIPLNKEKEFTISILIGVIVNVILNLFLITNLQALGTTIASVFAEFSVTIVQFYFLRNLVDFKKVLKLSFKPIIGSIIMYIIIHIVSIWLSIGILSTIIEIVTGTLVYIICMVLFKHELLFEILNKFKNVMKKV